jgi:hypothetical protein
MKIFDNLRCHITFFLSVFFSIERAQHGFFDLGSALSGKKYHHILIIRREELDEYKKMTQQYKVPIFCLPQEASGKHVGAARHWAKKFAQIIHNKNFPFVMIKDDSIIGWKGELIYEQGQNYGGGGYSFLLIRENHMGGKISFKKGERMPLKPPHTCAHA